MVINILSKSFTWKIICCSLLLISIRFGVKTVHWKVNQTDKAPLRIEQFPVWKSFHFLMFYKLNNELLHVRIIWRVHGVQQTVQCIQCVYYTHHQSYLFSNANILLIFGTFCSTKFIHFRHCLDNGPSVICTLWGTQLEIISVVIFVLKFSASNSDAMNLCPKKRRLLNKNLCPLIIYALLKHRMSPVPRKRRSFFFLLV